MEENREKYDKLKKEYDIYKCYSELQIKQLNERNIKLEKEINELSNIIEINNYVNSFLSKENLIDIINEMIIRILKVCKSTILLKEKGNFVVKATNINEKNIDLTIEEENYLNIGNSYIINSEKPLRIYDKHNLKIKSVVGVPIKIRDVVTGFVIVEHSKYNFMNSDNERILKLIANQVAIPIENYLLYKGMEEKAKMDQLLSIYNRKYFFYLLENINKENPNKSYAIVMVDLDDFKKFNDKYGHQVGDEILIETSEVIKSMLDEEDIIARYGGEEIIIYINNVRSIEYTYNKIEAIRLRVENNKIIKDGIEISVTASFGIGYYPKDGKNINEVIQVADKFLYRSKSIGKNTVLTSL